MMRFFQNWPWLKKNRPPRRIKLGICALDKKARSKPMTAILTRLHPDLFEIIIFGDDMILNQSVENWPVVEALIAFYSDGFPTEKALEYIRIHHPHTLNDLEMEVILADRRLVYRKLTSIGLPLPKHLIVERPSPESGESDPNVIEEFDEHIIINGQQLMKPFVEKPVSAEDHNIYIYYPASAGGGSKRLFRKRNDRSSEFYPTISEVRRTGSFIYEEFVATHGTDVKVYSVGPAYFHAEARKSPVVDGRVKRDGGGREVRYPVMLSQGEKEMARRIVIAFRQAVCGFDLLRGASGRVSYCCDVNGWSFVKNSRKYYDDAAAIIAEMFFRALRGDFMRTVLAARSSQVSSPLKSPHAITANSNNGLGGTSGKPKGHSGIPQLTVSGAEGETVLSSTSVKTSSTPAASARLVPLTPESLATGSAAASGVGEDERPPSPATSLGSDVEFSLAAAAAAGWGRPTDRRYENEELRCVIAVVRHGDRTPKQKMKLTVTAAPLLSFFRRHSRGPRSDLKLKSRVALVDFLAATTAVLDDDTTEPPLRRKLLAIRDVLERWEISGINRKLQMKPQKWEELPASDSTSLTGEASEDLTLPIPQMSRKVANSASGQATELLLILKWGGDLTPMGRVQAEELGTHFRGTLYPDGENGGVLRLHATFRHDLKIYASDEGRVMRTAAATAKGLLELEGPLTPILASLVTVEEKDGRMLDRGGNSLVKAQMDSCKAHLNLLQTAQGRGHRRSRKLSVIQNQADGEVENTVTEYSVEQDEELLSDSDADYITEEDGEGWLTPEEIAELAPGCPESVRASFARLANPRVTLRRMHELIGGLVSQLRELRDRYEPLTGIAMDTAPSTPRGEPIHQSSFNDRFPTIPAIDPNNGNFNVNSDNTGGVSPMLRLSRAASVTDSVPDDSSAPMATNNDQYTSQDPLAEPFPQLYGDETFTLAFSRWQKLYKDFAAPRCLMTTQLVGTTAPRGSISCEGLCDGDCPAPVLLATADDATNMNDGLSTNGVSTNGGVKSSVDAEDDGSGGWWFDLTKVADVYDMIRYDALHNRRLHLIGVEELFRLAAAFEAAVVPQEYGASPHAKRVIGTQLCGPLLEKIRRDLRVASSSSVTSTSAAPEVPSTTSMLAVTPSLVAATSGGDWTNGFETGGANTTTTHCHTHHASDSCHSADDADGSAQSDSLAEVSYTLDGAHAADLGINSLGRVVRTRLYFTSESHVQALLNCLRYPPPQACDTSGDADGDSEREVNRLSDAALTALQAVTDVSYLSHLVIRLFEDRWQAGRFTVELRFSSGTTADVVADPQNTVAFSTVIESGARLEALLGTLNSCIDEFHAGGGGSGGDISAPMVSRRGSKIDI